MSLPLPVVDPTDPRYTTRGAARFVPALQGPTIWAAGDVYTATASQTESLLGFVEASVVPLGGGPVPHVHNDQAELFYLLSGQLEFLDGDRTFTASAISCTCRGASGTRSRIRQCMSRG